MKAIITMVLSAVVALLMVSCNTDYKKTKSGLVYKIFPGGSKDSLPGQKNMIKFHVIRKLNDSLLFSTYGKMPFYQPFTDDPGIAYTPFEVLFKMKKGDSAIVIESADTLIKKGMQNQIPFAKKGDHFKTYMKVIEIFRVDSLAEKDYYAEDARDKPRREKEASEAEAKQKVVEVKEMQDYFAAKKINPIKAPAGTYVVINEKGNGEPVANGKFITVKYAGRLMKTDKEFQTSEYIFQLGQNPPEVIKGWEDGLTLFNKGGKGTLYVPGTLAYGNRPGPGGQTFEALVFDIEVLNVSDTREKANADKRIADSLAAKNPPKVK
jgi:FKBP-type peptidyl-prolyl cis-trans isomerase